MRTEVDKDLVKLPVYQIEKHLTGAHRVNALDRHGLRLWLARRNRDAMFAANSGASMTGDMQTANGVNGGALARGGACVLAAMLAVATIATAAAPAAPPLRRRPPSRTPERPATNPPIDPMAVPGFWDPRRRPERPDLSRISIIRFLTETDYPPFNYAGPDGAPAGFNVDLARLICEEIKVACTVQQRRLRYPDRVA